MFIGTELEKYLEIVRRGSMSEFLSQHDGKYLLGRIPEDSPEGDLDFYTGVVHLESQRKSMPPAPNPRREVLKPGTILNKIVKRAESAWSSWYSLGRANNNDIVIRHPSISKLHARLYTKCPVEIQSESNNVLWIKDMGSTKGTSLNGYPLDASTFYPLQLQDSIAFGDVEMLLLDAQILYARLSRMEKLV